MKVYYKYLEMDGQKCSEYWLIMGLIISSIIDLTPNKLNITGGEKAQGKFRIFLKRQNIAFLMPILVQSPEPKEKPSCYK